MRFHATNVLHMCIYIQRYGSLIDRTHFLCISLICMHMYLLNELTQVVLMNKIKLCIQLCQSCQLQDILKLSLITLRERENTSAQQTVLFFDLNCLKLVQYTLFVAHVPTGTAVCLAHGNWASGIGPHSTPSFCMPFTPHHLEIGTQLLNQYRTHSQVTIFALSC